MSSTLIACAEEAVLVDTLVTLDQVDALAEWVRGFGKRVTGVYITHGHQDHWIGLARIQEHFPEARGIATPAVVERARFEATNPGLSAYWNASDGCDYLWVRARSSACGLPGERRTSAAPSR
ncbi:MBL fold metallo-hydrolase [Streptomyces sp. CA-288835]|uniref:MBL fold metallo-hydrolase n=1 Tax=Streptomyces sp. CA-288835 TaxID=3240069 RepID=UPI003D92DDB8